MGKSPKPKSKDPAAQSKDTLGEMLMKAFSRDPLWTSIGLYVVYCILSGAYNLVFEQKEMKIKITGRDITLLGKCMPLRPGDEVDSFELPSGCKVVITPH